jgi:hypothetical protein
MTTDAASDTATESDDEPFRPAPLPDNLQEVLRIVVDGGNTCFLADDDKTILTGTPERPGPVVPCTVVDMLAMVAGALLAGERGLFLARRRGRHIAQHGSLDTYDDRLVAEDLAAWARGTTDYPEAELLESVEARHHEIALSRKEALEYLIERGVVSAAEARQDLVGAA